jgi:hypothetical protein
VAAVVALLVKAGGRPGPDTVRLAAARWPELRPVLALAAARPAPLLRLARRAVWRSLRRAASGTNIGPGVAGLRQELPDTLLRFLRF